jgi:ribosomal protein S18 acetylase RimI-like enzyme
VTVRAGTRADRDAVVEILATGFAEDPWFSWVWPEPDYLGHATEWFGLVTDVVLGKGEVLVADDGAAAALWLAPGVALAGPDELTAARTLLSRQIGARAGEVLAAVGASAASSPDAPHFSCAYVAVRPAARGRGVGRTVMAPPLAAADEQGTGVHLVSTNPRNLSFYERLGFTITAELPVAGGAATFRPMWRPPRPFSAG